MKKFITFFALAIAGAILTPLRPAEPVEDYSLKIGEFSRLKVIDGINVDYISNPDSAGVASFSSTHATASTIGFSNNNGELTISFTSTDVNRTGLPDVKVYSTFLTSVENAGDSTLRVLTVAPCPNFSAKQIGNGRMVVRDIKATKVRGTLSTGNGSVVINGKCDEALLKLAGTGTIQADGLEAIDVKCSAVGTGSIGCWPTKLLKIHGMGSTSIYYRGNPEIKNRGVGVKVMPMP